jgi:uncharacterized protein with HEPN domain
MTTSREQFLNQRETLRVIDNMDRWLAIRELRNISAHEYTESDLAGFFEQLKIEAPHLIAIKERF